jgi:hypothetical protein
MGAAEPASFDIVGETIRTNQYQWDPRALYETASSFADR